MMDDRTWDALVGTAQDTHTAVMTETGLIPAPALFALVDGRLAGYVRLRPVLRGQDAALGIVEMSYLAAAVRADEVVATWETYDVAIACEHDPLHPDTTLNVVRASPGEHVVQRLPYEARVLPRRRFRRRGRPRVEPWWFPKPPETPAGPLEPEIRGLLAGCWEPPGPQEPDSLDRADAWLTARGYTVRLATYT